jgi:hypothetical protein
VDEVDNHFMHRIAIGDPKHAYMSLSAFPFPTDAPRLDDFIELLSELDWAGCGHTRADTEVIRLSKPGLGYATYCRGCHTCVEYPLRPGCICDRREPGRWVGHQTICPRYNKRCQNALHTRHRAHPAVAP